MNITFLVSDITVTGGVQRVVSIIANELSKSSVYNISILSIFKKNLVPQFKLFPNISIDYLFPESEGFSIKFHLLKLVLGFRRFFKRHNTLLIFSGMGYGVPIYLALNKDSRQKIIGWEHQNFFFGKRFGFEWIGKRLSVTKFIKTIVLSVEDYHQYARFFKKKKNKIFQIPNPIDSRLLNSNNKYDVSSKKIISVGSLVPQKGFDLAIKVGELLFKKHPDWEWHIYGSGSDYEKLNREIKKKNLTKNMVLMGQVENVYSIYNKYSMYVMTSRHEGMPMVLLEAKSNSLPIVSFSCKCGPNDIIREEINGCLIKSFDIESMANSISDLVRNEEKRIQFSLNAQLDLNEYNLNKTIDRWNRLLHKDG